MDSLYRVVEFYYGIVEFLCFVLFFGFIMLYEYNINLQDISNNLRGHMITFIHKNYFLKKWGFYYGGHVEFLCFLLTFYGLYEYEYYFRRHFLQFKGSHDYFKS